MDNVGKLLKKLTDVRLRIMDAGLRKTGYNTYSKYAYFELHDFLPTTLKEFAKEGLCGIVSFTDTLATLTITDLENGSEVKITSPMSTAKLTACHDVQNLGAVETYLRRYLWGTAIELLEIDPVENQSVEPETEKAQKSSIKMPEAAAEQTAAEKPTPQKAGDENPKGEPAGVGEVAWVTKKLEGKSNKKEFLVSVIGRDSLDGLTATEFAALRDALKVKK